jgi:hypothetical protein
MPAGTQDLESFYEGRTNLAGLAFILLIALPAVAHGESESERHDSEGRDQHHQHCPV